MKATERLYLTADRTRVVKEGDPAANFLFVTPGKDISAADVKKYGITDLMAEAPADETETEAKAVDAAPEDKAVTEPAENKAEPAPRTRASRS